jgi:hypothetical protein
MQEAAGKEAFQSEDKTRFNCRRVSPLLRLRSHGRNLNRGAANLGRFGNLRVNSAEVNRPPLPCGSIRRPYVFTQKSRFRGRIGGHEICEQPFILWEQHHQYMKTHILQFSG